VAVAVGMPSGMMCVGVGMGVAGPAPGGAVATPVDPFLAPAPASPAGVIVRLAVVGRPQRLLSQGSAHRPHGAHLGGKMGER
jgi:hypothetical protein